MKQDSFWSGEPAVDAHSRNGGFFNGGASRREFLQVLAAAGAGALVPASGLIAQTPPQNRAGASRAKSGRVDVHHHPLPPEFMRRRQPSATGRKWTPEISIEQMDKFGIATAIASRPDIWYGNVQESVELARICNDYGAQMVRDYPGRFGLFAVLPLPDQDATLKEIQYAYDVLKADGVCMISSYGDKWPGDPAYLPAYEELNRRKAVVFIHPTTPNCCRTLIPGVAQYMVEFDFDLTRGVVSLLVNGVFSRFPDIRFIIAHSGGTLPVLAGRINDRFPKDHADRVPNGVPYELKRLYYEVAHATYGPPLAAVMKFVPTSQMLFGTDFPLEPMESTTEPLAQSGLSAKDLQAIDRGTAERLFPRLKA